MSYLRSFNDIEYHIWVDFPEFLIQVNMLLQSDIIYTWCILFWKGLLSYVKEVELLQFKYFK